MNEDEVLGNRLRERLPRDAPPPVDLERVARRAGRLRARRRALAGVGAAVLAAAVAVPLVLLAPLGGDHGRRPAQATESPPAAGSVVEGHGLSIHVPTGWDGRVYYNPEGGVRVLQVSNLELSPVPPAGPDDDLASMTRARMGKDDVVVVLWDLLYCPCQGFDAIDGPVAIEPVDAGIEGEVRGQLLARRLFRRDGRFFDLRASFGVEHPDPLLVRQVNDVLATLRIEPATEPAVRDGWTVHRDIEGGLSIETPASWGFREDPTPALISPSIRFAAGTQAEIRDGGECAPDRAIQDVPPDGALLWTVEYGDPGQPYTFPPRPEHLSLGDLQGPFECVGASGYVVQFRDGGRFFQVYVVPGPDASEATLADARDALDSIAVEPRGTDLTTTSCESGRWVDCPEAAWAYQVATEAGFAFHGDTADALEFAGRGANFRIHVDEQTGASCARGHDRVDGIAVCGDPDGTVLVWVTSDRVVTLTTTGGRAGALPSGGPLVDLVRASEETPGP
jgi:hypothetical protein